MMQSGQEVNPLLVHSGQVTAQPTKDGGPRLRAKATRDFLLDLDHAKIALSQIVIKGHDESMHEAQDQLLKGMQALQQIANIISSQRTAGPLFSERRRVGSNASLHQCLIAAVI